MDDTELKRRSKALAAWGVGLTEALPRTRVGDILARQLIRSLANERGATFIASGRTARQTRRARPA